MNKPNRNLTSIVSYPERGTGGNNRYRGNCSPKLIEDLIGFFKPAEICDYMCGSGTTQDAAHSMKAPVKPNQEQLMMGHLLEPIAAYWYQQKTGNTVHIAGKPRNMVLLTEGPMKADVIHYLTGQTVLAVAGVNSLTQLELILPQLHEQGVERIMTAFDMDFMENPHVQGGYRTLVSLLSDAGFRYGTYLWDPRYKGLDDYVWEHCFQRQLS